MLTKKLSCSEFFFFLPGRTYSICWSNFCTAPKRTLQSLLMIQSSLLFLLLVLRQFYSVLFSMLVPLLQCKYLCQAQKTHACECIQKDSILNASVHFTSTFTLPDSYFYYISYQFLLFQLILFPHVRNVFGINE